MTKSITIDEDAMSRRSYRLTYDPTPVEDGGYRIGAMFGFIAFSAYARGSFVPGTRFERDDGRKYVISGALQLVKVKK
jgi:hypothetical protein